MNDSRKVAMRLRFIDGAGAPVPGILVNMSTIPEAPKGADSGVTPLREPTTGLVNTIATVQTDAAGYCSVKAEPSVLAGASGISVTYGGSEHAVRNWTLAQLASTTLQTIIVGASDNPNIVPHLGLPSIIMPDAVDATISPGSIGTTPQLSPNSGICSQLAPTHARIRRFAGYTVQADICNNAKVTCREPVEFVRGQMFEYEIAWHPAGASLGDLLNTITLAPCEQVNIAIVDWMRRETASQSSTIDIQQQSEQTMNRDRLITDTMNSLITTKGFTAGGALGLKIPIKQKFDFTASLGAAGSLGSQQVVLNTTNQLTEKIVQTASFVSSERSTVVFQATASEQQTYQTRTIRNNNHCHTLTMEYYQVNENYSVETSYKGQRDVLLVKYDNIDFDAKRAYCKAELLKPALLDQNLLSCFDDLPDALFCCTDARLAAGTSFYYITLSFIGPMASSFIFSGQLNISNRAPITLTLPSYQIQNSGTFQFEVAIPAPPLGPLDTLAVTLDIPAGTLFSSIQVTGHISGDPTPIVLYSQAPVYVPWPASGYVGQMVLPLRASEEINDNSTACVDRSCSIQKLLGHLNCHKRYYNSLLWLSEDPNERVMRWSCCGEDGQLSVLGLIENDPITVYGDFVVFPGAGSELVPDSTIDPVTALITMPTPGVFSEGILGQCNTCETIDADRFWDWKSSPCPDNAPVITPTLSPQAGATPGTMKADTIANLITLTAVPDAGQSALKDIVASLVTEADSGSKAAQDLLGKLLDSLKTSVTETPAKPTSGGG